MTQWEGEEGLVTELGRGGDSRPERFAAVRIVADCLAEKPLPHWCPEQELEHLLSAAANPRALQVQDGGIMF